MFNESAKIWHNKNLLDWKAANIHVASHCLHYGSAVFEGIRAYNTPQGTGVFRLTDHMERLLDSARVYHMPVEYSIDDLCNAVFQLLAENNHDQAYIRPLVLRGYGRLGVDPRPNPVETYILTWNWGLLLGHASFDEGVDVCVSSWRRPAPDTLPMMAKSVANYMNSQLIKLEALVGGFAEGIALDYHGNISEGSGENIFIVKKGQLFTPPLTSSILPGITRDSVIQMAADLGIPCRIEPLPREMLYTADELFFCGTATEIAPIRSVDRIKVGKTQIGEITRALQIEFRKITCGEKDLHGWMDYSEISADIESMTA